MVSDVVEMVIDRDALVALDEMLVLWYTCVRLVQKHQITLLVAQPHFLPSFSTLLRAFVEPFAGARADLVSPDLVAKLWTETKR